MTTVATRPAILREWLADGRRVVSGMLVEVEGSAPLPPGATMLIDDRGNIEGSITGGCVEGAVAEEAEALLGGGSPSVVTYGISDDLAGTVGLMCGGTVHIFIHELDEASGAAELEAVDAAERGHVAAVATLLDGEAAGGKLAIVGDEVVGSLGGSELLDRNVARSVRGEIDEGKTTIRRFGLDGATLGSELRVHIRTFAPPPQMVIFGAIDFSAALAPIAKELGYVVTISDARERFARSRRFARSAEVVIGWPQEALSQVQLGPRDAVLVFTHDAKFDEPALLGALATDAGYIGALGSRKTTADRNRRLREAGATDADIERIHAPCGLDIGSRTAEETAISVLAEIIASRSDRRGSSLRETDGPIHPQESA